MYLNGTCSLNAFLTFTVQYSVGQQPVSLVNIILECKWLDVPIRAKEFPVRSCLCTRPYCTKSTIR